MYSAVSFRITGQFTLHLSPGALVALLRKQQKPPRRIKFLLERLDHPWDIHDTAQGLGSYAQSGSGRRSLTNDVEFTERRRSE